MDYTDDLGRDEYVAMGTFEIESEIWKQEHIEEFRELLLSDKDIVFEYTNESYEINSDNILYIGRWNGIRDTEEEEY